MKHFIWDVVNGPIYRVCPLAESEALLDELWSYAALAQNIWQQTWQPDDLIVWDNRRVLHRRDDFDNNARRLMKRCQVLARNADD